MSQVSGVISEAIISHLSPTEERGVITYRLGGDRCVLVEVGEETIDFRQRIYVYLLEQAIYKMKIAGIKEITPGIRSMQIIYDNSVMSAAELVEVLKMLDKTIDMKGDVKVPSRRLVLPIVFNDHWTREAIDRYRESIRAEAPYLPDNIEFLARCNGLSGPEEVIQKVLSTDYIVLGQGDGYLGTPLAIAMDPRSRLLCPKYNPARTYTKEGTVGLGGSFLAYYAADAPGGYQLIGRSLPVFDSAQINDAYKEHPWLFRSFDRLGFEEVTEEEFSQIRNNMADYEISIEDGFFSIEEYENFLDSVKEETEKFERQQQEAIKTATIGL